MEIAWNTYPSTRTSSLLLFIAHVALLLGVYNGVPEDVTAKGNRVTMVDRKLDRHEQATHVMNRPVQPS